MKWLDQLERRFHFVAIPQFPLFIATANGLIYLMDQIQPAFVGRLLMDPAAVRAGEWWRVITFLFVPPVHMNPIFLVFWLLIMYQFSQALENAWGEFRFFFFYFIGAAATVLASLLIQAPIGNYSLYMTIYLAFATLFPDFELLLFFILPLKVKYIAWFMWFTTALSFLMGSFTTRVEIGSSLLNYALFFGPDIGGRMRHRWEVYRNRRRFRP